MHILINDTEKKKDEDAIYKDARNQDKHIVREYMNNTNSRIAIHKK